MSEPSEPEPSVSRPAAQRGTAATTARPETGTTARRRAERPATPGHSTPRRHLAQPPAPTATARPDTNPTASTTRPETGRPETGRPETSRPETSRPEAGAARPGAGAAAIATPRRHTGPTPSHPATTAAPGATSGAAGKRPGATPWLALVALAYALVQCLLVVPPLAHALGWDETVYVSQYDPRVPAAFFSAPRSRGVSFLTAPFIAATSSVLVLRIGLTLLSSAALYAAFRVWRPVAGARTTALAALLFAGLWITQISGPQAMPNLWVAFGAVAATGWFLRAVTGREPRANWWLAGCVAVTALFRAPDAVWLALPLIATALFRSRRTLAYLVGGLAAGLAQWVAEAYIRFGSVQDRLHVSSATEGDMGLHLNFDNAWSSLNGPLLCRPCTATVDSPGLTLWWLALPLLAAAALAHAMRERRLLPTALPMAVAAALSVPYLLMIDYSAPRFLLPAYALLALPVAGLVTRLNPRRGLVLAGLLIAAQLVSQATVLTRVTASTAITNERYRAAADSLRTLGLRPPCLVSGPRALPIAYDAGCASAQVDGNNVSTTVAGILDRAAKVPTALLTAKGQRPPHYARDWTPYPLHHTPGWTAWLAPAGPQGP
ncbi:MULTISPECIES: hypothetical protein [unclassified Streptomyces]|uniref:Integral membrane protein n=1 Tax=Streptomyces sp. NBC_00119 TaxID=2975659 RepID=A0AAU1U768_9ACTN|nr:MULTISPECIES: hypothetical protein [unclassified Streptomyces]MCX4643918.1 hypothetical protein [Streptomyces sp. NBC_01446]MCX5325028.1 hypothetical protein [Streptomyces sp. NBC_00120]